MTNEDESKDSLRARVLAWVRKFTTFRQSSCLLLEEQSRERLRGGCLGMSISQRV